MKRIPATLNFDSLLLTDPDPEERQRATDSIKNRLTGEFEQALDSYIKRIAELPPYMVIKGDFVRLLEQARLCYIYGYYYACASMCGIVAERIIKDIFIGSIRFWDSNSYLESNGNSDKSLEKFNARYISKVLIDFGILPNDLSKSIQGLMDIRNKFVHGRGIQEKSEAIKATKFLQDILDTLLSRDTKFEIKNGRIIPFTS